MADMVNPHGRAFIPRQLVQDVLRLLAPDDVIEGGQNWLMTLVCDYKQQAGLDADYDLPTPKSWNSVTEIDDWPLGRLPAVLVLFGGSDDVPARGPDGYYSEPVRLSIAVIDSADKFADALDNAGIYATAARAAISQHLLDLPDPLANVTSVMAGMIDAQPRRVRDQSRKDTVASGLVACRVTIADSLTDTVDIVEPPENPCDPIEEGPTVKTDGAVIRLNPDD